MSSPILASETSLACSRKRRGELAHNLSQTMINFSFPNADVDIWLVIFVICDFSYLEMVDIQLFVA